MELTLSADTILMRLDGKFCILNTLIKKGINKMVGLMKYECGLKFTGCVFEDKETAEKFIYDNGLNPEAYELIPVAGYFKNDEIK